MTKVAADGTDANLAAGTVRVLSASTRQEQSGAAQACGVGAEPVERHRSGGSIQPATESQRLGESVIVLLCYVFYVLCW